MSKEEAAAPLLGRRLDRTVPPTLGTPGAAGFWLAVLLTGVGAGAAAALLTRLLDWVQHVAWPGGDLLEAATAAAPWRHIGVLLGAGALVGLGQFVLERLTSANGIDIAAAITRHAGRLPALRTVGSAILSIFVVGMGASLGREGAPKQVGAVVANVLADRRRLSDDRIPAYPASLGVVCWAALAGPIMGLVSVAYVRLIAWADRHKLRSRSRYFVPLIALGLLGLVSVRHAIARSSCRRWWPS